MRRPPTLPRGVAWWVRRVVPAARRDDVLGDLAEAWAARLRGGGALRAHVALWRECAALVAWRLGAGMSGASDEDHGDHGRTATMWGDLVQDLRYGARALARNKAFTALAVAVLALGVAGPTAVLSLVDTIFFARPEAVHEPHRLVRVYRAPPSDPARHSVFGNPGFRDLRAGATTLTGLAAWSDPVAVAWSPVRGEPGQVDVAFVSHDWFDVLGVSLPEGRAFLPEEDREPGARPVAVLSSEFRERAFAGEDVVGTSIVLNGVSFRVVGVAPPGLRGVSPLDPAVDAWAPIAMYGALTRPSQTSWWERLPGERWNWLDVVGRLAPDATAASVRANLEAVAAAMPVEDGEERAGVHVRRQILYAPSQEETLRGLSRMLGGAVVLVLLIAVANVAVLLLTRSVSRGREMALRAALGAGRARLARQLLAETLLLGAAAGALGVGLAWLLVDAAGALLPYDFATSFRPDGGVLAAALALALGVSVLAGLAPVLGLREGHLRSGLRRDDADGGGARARHGLVVVQVALSVTLLAGSLLFTGSLWAARTQEIGFETDDRLVTSVDLRGAGYDEEEGKIFVDRALERLGALPGVRAVATSQMIPFRGWWSTSLPDPGAAPGDDAERIEVFLNTVSPGYFDLMGIPVLRGRPLDEDDRPGSPPAVVVSEAFVQRFLPGDVDPVGRTVGPSPEEQWTIVGVAADVTYGELGEDPVVQAWYPLAQRWRPGVHFIVHAPGAWGPTLDAVHRVLRELDPELTFPWSGSLAGVLDDEVARYEVTAILVGAFGLLALVLTGAGLYGVVSFLVARRTREIGVRMALGADRGSVARQVLAVAARLTAAGAVVGLLGAWWARGLTRSLLYGVEATDPRPLAGSLAVLTAVALLAAWSPARRATRVDPLTALRSE